MESSHHNSLKGLLLSKKGMLKQELFPFLDIANVIKLLHLNKTSSSLITEHFTGDF